MIFYIFKIIINFKKSAGVFIVLPLTVVSKVDVDE